MNEYMDGSQYTSHTFVGVTAWDIHWMTFPVLDSGREMLVWMSWLDAWAWRRWPCLKEFPRTFTTFETRDTIPMAQSRICARYTALSGAMSEMSGGGSVKDGLEEGLGENIPDLFSMWEPVFSTEVNRGCWMDRGGEGDTRKVLDGISRLKKGVISKVSSSTWILDPFPSFGLEVWTGEESSQL